MTLWRGDSSIMMDTPRRIQSAFRAARESAFAED
jgi:hypothetical protein